jgi:HAD superfamily hydrolase (TIGR01490 family)
VIAHERAADGPAPEPACAPAARPIVAAFDFDGTITARDTLKPFLVRAFGLRAVARAFIAEAPLALRVGLRRARVDDFKLRAIARLFAGAQAAPLRVQGQAYARELRPRLRPAALERIGWHRARGHVLVLVSASIDVYLEHVARDLGFDHLVCTRPSTRASPTGERFDGGLVGEDCTGAGKVRALLGLLGARAGFELHVYGDARGDRELLALADHPHFRPFR